MFIRIHTAECFAGMNDVISSDRIDESTNLASFTTVVVAVMAMVMVR